MHAHPTANSYFCWNIIKLFFFYFLQFAGFQNFFRNVLIRYQCPLRCMTLVRYSCYSYTSFSLQFAELLAHSFWQKRCNYWIEGFLALTHLFSSEVLMDRDHGFLNGHSKTLSEPTTFHIFHTCLIIVWTFLQSVQSDSLFPHVYLHPLPPLITCSLPPGRSSRPGVLSLSVPAISSIIIILKHKHPCSFTQVWVWTLKWI